MITLALVNGEGQVIKKSDSKAAKVFGQQGVASDDRLMEDLNDAVAAYHVMIAPIRPV